LHRYINPEVVELWTSVFEGRKGYRFAGKTGSAFEEKGSGFADERSGFVDRKEVDLHT
jgi:hypothetical protein